jgi:hypothetical protein
MPASSNSDATTLLAFETHTPDEVTALVAAFFLRFSQKSPAHAVQAVSARPVHSLQLASQA